MEKIVRGYIFIFVMMLAAPYVIYLYAAKYLDLENHENHTLVTMQDVFEASWKEKTMVLEDYINDHIPYKNELTRLNTRIDIQVFQSLDSQSVLLGKENWLFYKKDNCIEDYCKTISLTEEDISATVTAVQKMQHYCNENGIRLAFMVTPNKETIYGEYYMPDYVHASDRAGRADVLLETIKNHSDVNIIFPKEELLRARDAGYQVYRKYDTHWNRVGGFIGTMCLLDAIGMETQSLRKENVKKGREISGDLANMIAMGDVFHDDTDDTVAAYKDDVELVLLKERQETSLNYRHYRSDSANDQVIMCLGDSFLEMTEEYIAKNYAESYFMTVLNYREHIVEEEKPDILVITSTERAFPGLHGVLDVLLESL